MLVVVDSEKDLQHNLETINKELKKYSMGINKKKTKTMVVGNKEVKHRIKVEGNELEQVKSYKYLGVIINSEGNIKDEINERLAKTGNLFRAIKSSVLGKCEIPERTKAEVVKKIVKPILTYASESWVTTEKQRQSINSVEMRFLRKIKGKTRRDRIRNEVFREQLNIQPIEWNIEQNQIRWLGHVNRMGQERLVKKVYEARELGKKGEVDPEKRGKKK